MTASPILFGKGYTHLFPVEGLVDSIKWVRIASLIYMLATLHKVLWLPMQTVIRN